MVELASLAEALLGCVGAFASVVDTSMGSYLGDYNTAIADHRAKWEAFEDEYRKVFGANSRSILTPKQAVIWFVLPMFLARVDRPLTLYSEQAFETTHKLYTQVADRYSIPRTGMELIAGRRRKTSHPNFGKRESDAPPPRKRRRVGNVALARKRRWESICGFTLDRLPSDVGSKKRQRIAYDISKGSREHLVQTEFGWEKPWNVGAP